MLDEVQPQNTAHLRRGTLRWRRIKAVWEGRCAQLQAARRKEPGAPSYGQAVWNYDRARRRWRAIRGWS